jgi:hypothetical protein
MREQNIILQIQYVIVLNDKLSKVSSVDYGVDTQLPF